MKLSKIYNPKQVDTKIYKFWQKSNFFNPDKLPSCHKKPYCIVIPPPNITGSLHMGHALNAVTQDVLIRWHRLQGYKTLWLPGTDHAGIATQVVVEKELKKEDSNRFDLGREKFVERIWKWKEKYGNIILEQLKKMGASCDWSRTRFTMDKDYALTVENAFSHYYKKGWIYRRKRVVNWCPRCQTSLSDLEIEYKEEKGQLWYIKYPLVKNPKFQTLNPKQIPNSKFKIPNFITVATTRPETMLGDTAVAVNPRDERYKKIVGKKAILPLANREIPIIADRSVDSKFGTGAVKITPAHDLTDYEIGLKHNLKTIQVIDEKSLITEEAPKKYQGLLVLETRKKIVEDLKNLGYLEKIEDYSHQVPHCKRCKTIIELIPSWQWFLKMKKLAKLALKPVKKGEVEFIPKRWEKIYFNWLKNIRDWCLSRQIWWGHQIPIWYCGNSKNIPELKMGFHKDVVPQIFKGKIKTYRLLDHGFRVGDKVLFENSQTKTYFGCGIITNAEETKIEKINYKDKAHYKTYRSLKELIAAFRFRNPDKKVTPKSKAYLYEYKFRPFTKEEAKKGCGQIIVSIQKPKRCPACKGINLHRDHDVLDTWFSSALWPFAVLGWPKRKKDLEKFYPTDVLSTDPEIINLWVARMVFSGMEFMKKIPFKKIYIHATVLTREGKRMSKSLGVGIDPLNLIEKYGSDATRLGIAWQIMGGQDIKFVEDNIIMGKKFCNKLWNASRFVLFQISNSKFQIPNSKLTSADKKILKALDQTIKSVNEDLENFRLGKATHNLYHFFWHDFCDNYIEEAKPQLKGGPKIQKQTQQILLYVLLNSLKLLHPFIPFITEEIYQKLPIYLPKFSKGKFRQVKNKTKCLMVEKWPILY